MILKNTDSFLILRPPGHHSDMDINQGYCLINNVYIGVKYLKEVIGINKIAIIDWDVHHGNGTQKLFYKDNTVLFIDIHRYGNGFYPKTGAESEIGDDIGINYTVNIPLNKNSDETIYLDKFNTIIIPKLQDFNPEIIVVSCGFDAHKNDPIGGMCLESSSYKKFHKLLKQLDKKQIYFLEGGYDKNIVLECILQIV
jgi:acetoin utilization deacetylase AcuC-like enzyme